MSAKREIRVPGNSGSHGRANRGATVALSSVLLLAACGGSGGGDGGAPATALTGMVQRGAAGGCIGGITTARSTAGTVMHDATLAENCAFTVELEAREPSYVQLLGADGAVVALLGWLDPTKLADGITIDLTVYTALPAGTVHDLGAVRVVDLQAEVDGWVGAMAPSFEGAGGLSSAVPEHPPAYYDIDANGVPEVAQVGFPTGSDADGDGVPELDGPSGCAVPSAPLFGRIQVMLFRDDLSAEDRVSLGALDPLPSDVTLTPTGFMRGPVAARGLWVVVGDTADQENMWMADETGTFTIETLPPGVRSARVYRSMSDEQPLMTIPLCGLQTSEAAVTDDNAYVHFRFYANSCGMDSGDHSECGHDAQPDPTDEEIQGASEALHVSCGPSNRRQCCLDYDGSSGTTGEPHGTFESIRSYFGSTCERYVDSFCCTNEMGTVYDLAMGNLFVVGTELGFEAGIPQVQCWRNHDRRNCQSVDLTDGGLVLSADEAKRDAHDASVTTERIEVACGSTTTLYHYNNTCQNEDNIRLIGCGELTPEGANLRHGHTGDRDQPNQLNLDLTYTAPDSSCAGTVLSCAGGKCRSVVITVSCGTGTPRGACCYSDGACADDLLVTDCTESGGFLADGAMCSDIGCGACCRRGGCIANVNLPDCSEPGDMYAPGASCDTFSCGSDFVPAVKLDYTLGVPGASERVYDEGSIVPLCRISGGTESGADAGCPGSHYHGGGGPIFIDGTFGPFEDTAPGNCGYGRIVYVPDTCP